MIRRPPRSTLVPYPTLSRSLASNVQFPTPANETTPPDRLHTEVELESTVIVTGNPTVELAVGLYVAPPTVAPAAAVLASEIVWLPVVLHAMHNTQLECFTNQPFATITMFFFNDTPPTEIYTRPLPDALPIFGIQRAIPNSRKRDHTTRQAAH